MSEAPKVQKQGTMEATAAEGVAFLKAQKADSLIEAQGLNGHTNGTANGTNGHGKEANNGEVNGDAPAVSKTHTMAETVKEGEAIVGDDVDKDAKTRGQQKILDEANDQPVPVKATKTMEATMKEGEAIASEVDGKTRSQGKHKLDEDESSQDSEAPDAKKARDDTETEEDSQDGEEDEEEEEDDDGAEEGDE